MSYIQFNEGAPSASGKTRTWMVRSDGDLAQIFWHAPWRKYCVRFNPSAIFDPSCMQEILDFCKARTQEHKNAAL